MAARAHRGRSKVLVAQGAYHGSQPWANRRAPGAPGTEHDAFPVYVFNDVASVEAAVWEHSGDIAGIMTRRRIASGAGGAEFRGRRSAPVRPGRCGADSRRRARRFSPQPRRIVVALRDSPRSFRLGQGHRQWRTARRNARQRALPGRHEVGVRHRVLLVSVRAHGGQRLRDGIDEVARLHQERIRQSGPPQMPAVMFEDDPNCERGLALCSRLIERGVYFHPWHNMFLSLAHTEDDIDRTIEAVDGAMGEL